MKIKTALASAALALALVPAGALKADKQAPPAPAKPKGFSVPKPKLKEETVKLAKKLMEKSPAVLRYTKEGIRAVRFMNEPQAADYLNAKSDALKLNDKENSRQEGMRQFLDEKTYRPGLGNFKRKKASAK